MARLLEEGRIVKSIRQVEKCILIPQSTGLPQVPRVLLGLSETSLVGFGPLLFHPRQDTALLPLGVPIGTSSVRVVFIVRGVYLCGAKAVVIEDPYIRLQHQIQNFVRFCETLLKTPSVKKISLITGYDDNTQLADIAEKLEELKQSLLELDVELEVKLNPNMHDREIRLDNGWVIKIGRGLDFYQKPGGWFEVGANDLSLRKCLETKVDIFKA